MEAVNKTELLVTAKNLEELELLIISGANAVTIGSSKYGLRLPGDFSIEMIRKGIEIAHGKGAKVYILMNSLLHNQSLTGLEEYIKKMAEYEVDAIVFGDPAVFLTVQKVAPSLTLHWNTETTSTNYQTVNYWAEKGVQRAIVARELSLDEVIDIKQKTNIEIQAQVHGLTTIFHSKRNLISNYLEHTGKDEIKKKSGDSELYLREHKRPDEKYPVIEDIHGTHIMSNHDICMIEHIDKFIGTGIDSLKIEGIMHSTEYLVKVTKVYRLAIDEAYQNKKAENLFGKIKAIQPENRPLDTGFYFKEQRY